MKHLFLSPHNDDAVLFGSFTLQRLGDECVTVVIYNSIKQGLGTSAVREREDEEAFVELGSYPPTQFSFPDDKPNSDKEIAEAIVENCNCNELTVWAPAIYVEGHAQHNQVGRVAGMLGANSVRYYHTYVRRVEGKVEGLGNGLDFHPMQRILMMTQRYGQDIMIEESRPEKFEHVQRKLLALACYRSQILRSDNFAHFLRDQREWVVPA
jgi:LmbE family N-acetylglucosaminyl deacetylase